MADGTDEKRSRTGRHSLQDYESILESIGDATYSLDEAGRFTAVNEALVAITGYDRETLLGEHVSAVMTDADIETGEKALRELLADPTRNRATFEMDLLTDDGDSVPCENHVALLTTESEPFGGTVGVLRDITDRKEDERALRAERAFTENVLGAIPDVLYVFDEDGRFLRWNDRLRVVTGYSNDTIASMTPFDFVTPADAEAIAEAISTVLDTGIPQTREARLLTKGGDTIPYRFSGSLVTNAEGSVEGIIGLGQDITERKARERTLGSLHDATRAMMGSTTREEVCEIAVGAAERVLEYPITLVRLLDDDSLVPVAATARTTACVGDLDPCSIDDTPAGRAYAAGETLVHDDIGPTDESSPEATAGTLRAAIYVPLGAHGVIAIGDTETGGFDGSAVDLANVLAANTEAALDRVEREARLRRREAELERQNARIEEFASVISHDIRNPLNVITGNVALARETGDPSYLEPIERAAGRVTRLTKDLLTLARQGRTVESRRPVRLAPLVREAWSVAGCESTSLVLDDRLTSSPVRRGTIEADPTRLQHLFENLLANAVEHAGRSATVEVGPLPDGDGFYVADDGPGIPLGNRERVFEHDFTTSDDGLGLGLFIVETVADAHGWSTALTESASGGARFEFRTRR